MSKNATNTNSSVTMQPLAQGDWDWVEIHWSKKDSWDLDTYSCPILDNVEGALPGVDAIPKKHSKKTIEELYETFSKNKDADIDLHDSLKKASEDFEQNNGIICSAVRQWVIVEIAFAPEKTPMISPQYPEFELWAFLQPQHIGKKKTMKENLGYVIEDFPRGGWFHIAVRHIEEGSNGAFNPHLAINHPKKETYSQLGPVEWKKTTEETKSSKRHERPTRERYLFKIEVIVRNLDREEDRLQKNETVYNFIREKRIRPLEYITKNELPPPTEYFQENNEYGTVGQRSLTPLEMEKLFKFETGSYLKVWARNSHLPWGGAFPSEFDDDEFMVQMHLHDCPEVKSSNGKRPDMTFALNYLKEKGSDGKADLPKDWQYEERTGEFFRPYSYRNHVWKRNRFSMDPEGKFEKDKWYYVGLWPTEVVHAVEHLEESLFQKPKTVAGHEPSKASTGVIFGVTIAYMAIMGIGYKVISGLKGGDEKKKKMGANLQKLLGAGDLPKVAAMFASYGFPDKKEKDWLGVGKEKSFDNMKSKYGNDVKKNGMVTFFTKFYKILQVLTSGALDMLDGKDTLQLINNVMSSNGATDSDFEGFNCKEFSLLEGKIEVELAKGHYTKRLGGSTLPPPFLMWLAWTVSLKLTYGVTVSGEFKSFSDMKFGVSPEGSAGIFFDLGAVWTLSRELGAAYTGPVERITDQQSSDYGEKKGAHPFADTLSEIFSYVDIQIGCGIKLSLKGNLAIQMDFSPGDTDDKGKKKERFKFPDDDKPSLVVDLSMPIYGKLSVLSKEFKAVSCDLMFLSPSAIALLPTGLYLGNTQILDGAESLRFSFSKAKVDGTLNLPQNKEFCIGESFVSSALTNGIVDKKDRTLLKELPFFKTYLKEPNSPKIELETKSFYSGPGDDLFDSHCQFASTLTISQNKILTSADYGNAIKKLLKNGFSSELNCCYAGDINQVAHNSENVTIIAPRIAKFDIKNKKALYKITDVVEIEFTVINCMQKDLPLYLKVFEKDIGVDEVKITKDSKTKEGYFTCQQFPGKPGLYFCTVSLGELEKIDSFMEVGDFDLVFKVSVDFEGEYPLFFSNGNNYSSEIQYEKQ